MAVGVDLASASFLSGMGHILCLTSVGRFVLAINTQKKRNLARNAGDFVDDLLGVTLVFRFG
jgi:hypothetical protein